MGCFLQLKCGITAVISDDSTDIASKVASEINDFNPEMFTWIKGSEKEMTATHNSPSLPQITMLSRIQGYPGYPDLIPDRTGVIVGSGIGGMETIEKQMTALIERGPRRVSPFMIPSLIANIAMGSLPSILKQTDQIIRRLVPVLPVPMPLGKLLR